jgi:glycosyltransferase involved in cell wall biosynthesis
MFGRYFDRRDVAVIPHGTPAPARRAPGAHTAVLLPRDGLPVVVVLGAIGPDKGARRVERLAALAAQRDAPVRFVVIGYLDVERGPWQSDDARLTVHGEYDPRDLPDLLAHYGAALVLYPSEGPETFSYTLSEAWHAGLPVLVPPIGALHERVEEAGGDWVLRDDEWRDDARMLDRLVELLSAPMQGARAQAAAAARAFSQPTPEAMAQATLARYEAAVGTSPQPATFAPFDNARVRDALGYRAWSPPLLPAPAPESAHDAARERRADGVWRRIAERALAIRRTPMGRVLYRMTPAPVIDALKARLHG